MSGTDWQISGEYMESCNCDYLCPCIYTNPQAEVTHDHCTAALIFRIDEGRRGGTEPGWAVLRAGDPLRQDHGRRQLGVCRRGGRACGCGAARGVIGDRRRRGRRSAGHDPQQLVSDFRGVEFKPIEFKMEGLKRSVSIPDVLSFEIEGAPSRNRSGARFYIDNTAHPAGRRLALARTGQLHVHGFGLDLDMVGKGNNGHFAPFAWAA